MHVNVISLLSIVDHRYFIKSVSDTCENANFKSNIKFCATVTVYKN